MVMCFEFFMLPCCVRKSCEEMDGKSLVSWNVWHSCRKSSWEFCFQQQLLSQFVVHVEIESMFPLIPKTGRKCLLIGIELGLIKIKCCLKNAPKRFPGGLTGNLYFHYERKYVFWWWMYQASQIPNPQTWNCSKLYPWSFPKKAFDEFIAREMRWKYYGYPNLAHRRLDDRLIP